MIALAVAGMLAAVPAGVALAGGSDDRAGGGSNSAGQRGDGERDRGGGERDRGDCPEKNRQGGQSSVQI